MIPPGVAAETKGRVNIPHKAKPIFPRIILQLYLPHRFYLTLYILVPPFLKINIALDLDLIELP
jgi:hypothetical protein